MLSRDQFKLFEERYKKIINADVAYHNKHIKLQAFILGKITSKTNIEQPKDFNFNFDSQKQKLIFSITGGIWNGAASDITRYFRNYDDQACWYLRSDQRRTIRTFELDLEKVGDRLLDDFEAYISNQQSKEANISTEEKIYIEPAKIKPEPAKIKSEPIKINPEPAKINNNPSNNIKSNNMSTICKFAGVFAIGATIAAYKLMSRADDEQRNIFGHK